MLKRVEPFVAFGYPNVASVRELLYKRGFAKVGGQRLPINDNALIERHLGRYSLSLSLSLSLALFALSVCSLAIE
jgi:large subunit ribosomal protein L7e